MKKPALLSVLFLLAAGTVGCATAQSAGTGHVVNNPEAEAKMKDVAQEAVKNEAEKQAAEAWAQAKDPTLGKKLVTEQKAVLIDVRPATQYAEKHLPGAQNVPLDNLEKSVDAVVQLNGGDKSKPVVLYCNSGRTAYKAKVALEAAGFSQVVSAGGIGDWPQDQTPVDGSSEETSQE